MITVAVFLAVFGWAVVTAPLSTADEPRHFNSVLRLMQGGGWPEAKSAPMLEGTRVASAEAGDPIVGPPLESLPAPEDRARIGELDDPADPLSIDWMTQHPPGYYALVAGTVSFLGGSEWRWDQLVLGMRTLSAVLAAAAVPFLAATTRLVTGSRAAGLIGSALLLAIPQYGHVLSLVTNDSLATFLGAVLMYLVARAVVGSERTYVLAAITGLALGAALLTKGLMLAAIPVVLLAFLIRGWRTEPTVLRRLAPGALSMTVAFAVGGWWWFKNLIVYGELQPSVFGSGRDAAEPDDEYGLGIFAVRVLLKLNKTIWGSFRPELLFPDWVSLVAGVVAFLVLLAACVFSKRRDVLFVLAIYPILTLAIISFHAWEIFWDTGTIRGIQGRYLYGSLTLLAVSVGFCWELSMRRASSALRSASAAVLVMITGALGAAGWLFAYEYLWSAVGFRSMASSGAAPAWLLVALGITAAIALVTAAASAAVLARAPSNDAFSRAHVEVQGGP